MITYDDYDANEGLDETVNTHQYTPNTLKSQKLPKNIKSKEIGSDSLCSSK